MTGTRREARFGRMITAMATPFTESGELDREGAVVLARHLVTNGSDALVLSGSTGEASTLDDDERSELWRAVLGAVDAPVIAGSTSNDTAHSVELTARATEDGVHGILAVTPYYSRPSQAGIEAHFRAVAAATNLPVICYDIPIRTGRKIARETMLRLANEVPNIVGVKDAAGDPAETARLLAAAPADFECYVGDDGLTLPLLSIGAGGLISVAAHWCGPQLKQLIECYLAGDVDGALAINRAIAEAVAFQSSDEAPNPIPAKAMLRVLGLPAGECRLPLGPAPAGLEERAKSVIAQLESRFAAAPPHG